MRIYRCFFDNLEILDVDKAVIGLAFEDTHQVVQAICKNFEVCEVGRNGCAGDLVVHDFEHPEIRLPFFTKCLKDEGWVKVWIGLDLQGRRLSSYIKFIENFEIADVIESELV